VPVIIIEAGHIDKNLGGTIIGIDISKNTLDVVMLHPRGQWHKVIAWRNEITQKGGYYRRHA